MKYILEMAQQNGLSCIVLFIQNSDFEKLARKIWNRFWIGLKLMTEISETA